MEQRPVFAVVSWFLLLISGPSPSQSAAIVSPPSGICSQQCDAMLQQVLSRLATLEQTVAQLVNPNSGKYELGHAHPSDIASRNGSLRLLTACSALCGLKYALCKMYATIQNAPSNQ